jgi:hypothetical protein
MSAYWVLIVRRPTTMTKPGNVDEWREYLASTNEELMREVRRAYPGYDAASHDLVIYDGYECVLKPGGR